MKKLALLLIFTIFQFYSASSVNWAPYIDTPCSSTPNQTDWGTLKEFHFCLDQVCDKCCFTIIYYERWIGNPAVINEVFVAGVFNDGNLCCSQYNDETVVNEFFKQLFYDKSKDNNDFYNLVNTGGVLHPPLLSVKGECKINGGESCGPTCCDKPIQLNFEVINGIHTVTSIVILNNAVTNQPPCNNQIPNCAADCSVHNKGVVPLLCPIPCDFGAWSSPPDLRTIDVPECPGCQISFSFQTRSTTGCQPLDYNDYRILDWTKSNCGSCNISETDYLGDIVFWLLNNGGLPLPTNTNYIDNYRVMNTLCWKFVGNTAVSCDETKCCIKYYKICKLQDEQGNWRYYIYDLTPPGPVEQCVSPCVRICNPTPY